MSQHALQTGVLMLLTRSRSVLESGVRNVAWAHTHALNVLWHTHAQSHGHLYTENTHAHKEALVDSE